MASHLKCTSLSNFSQNKDTNNVDKLTRSCRRSSRIADYYPSARARPTSLHSWQLDGLVPTAALLLGLDNGRRAAIGRARALGSRGGQCWEPPRATWHQPYLTSNNLSTTTPKYRSYHASPSCPVLDAHKLTLKAQVNARHICSFSVFKHQLPSE